MLSFYITLLEIIYVPKSRGETRRQLVGIFRIFWCGTRARVWVRLYLRALNEGSNVRRNLDQMLFPHLENHEIGWAPMNHENREMGAKL